MTVLGIDPGKSGAVARINLVTRGLDLWRDFDNEEDLIGAIVEGGVGCQHAAIERVHSMPVQGVVSSFTFGYWTGVAVGACKALGLCVHRPTPQVWQKDVGTHKDQSRETAIATFPGYAEFFCRKLDHGSADAALMALWLSRKLS